MENPAWKWWTNFSGNWTHHQSSPPDPDNFVWPTGFMFQNAFVCSQCYHQFHQSTVIPENASAIPVDVGPMDHLLPRDFHPRASLHSLIWKNVRQDDSSIIPYVCAKNYVDPMAVIRHGIHVAIEPWSMTGGSIRIPTQVCVRGLNVQSNNIGHLPQSVMS